MKKLLLFSYLFLLAFGGWAQSPNSWTQKSDVGFKMANGPTVRIDAVGFSIGTKGYVGTGFKTGGGSLSDFWEYDPATDIWTQKANFGGGIRIGAVGFSIGSKGYIGTGAGSSGYMNDFWEYNPATNTWTQKVNFGGSNRQHAVGFSIGTKGYIGTGGVYNSGSNTYFKDFWEYDPVTDAWTQKADFAGTARQQAFGFGIGTKGYLGNGSDGNNTSDFWEYNPSTNAWVQKTGPQMSLTDAVGFSSGTKGYVGTGWYGASIRAEFFEYNPTGDFWTQKADMPGRPRNGAAGFVIGTKCYIGMGYEGGSNPKNDFWSYDISANTWTQKANLGGTPRIEAISFSIGSKGYFGTGKSSSGNNYNGDFWEYDPATDVWTQKASFMTGDLSSWPNGFGRYGAVGFSIGTKGYIGVGYGYTASGFGTNYTYLSDFWEYDPATNSWTQKANFGGFPRTGAVGFSIGTKGYIGTGFQGGYGRDFWEYNPATNTWAQKANFGGTARSGAVGFSIGTKGYIGTGNDVSGRKKDFWEYDPATNTWLQKADFGGDARYKAVGFSISGKGYIGSGAVSGVGGTNDFWEYDPVSNSWTQKVNFGGTGRQDAIGFSIAGKGYMGTGYNGNLTVMQADFWEFTPGNSPAITSFTPNTGAVGDVITITGTNFTGATAVQFNSTNATVFTVNSSTQITATVPGGATTGPLKVTTPEGTAVSNSNFTIGVSPTITTGTISGTSFCAGASVSVPYTITGTFNSGNVFTAQLSNASGSFASPVSIGTLTGTTAGTVSATIPANTAAGVGYRIRIAASAPSTTGTDNGTNLTIMSRIADPVATASPASITLGQSATLSVSNASPNATYSWNGPGVSNQAGTIISVTPATAGTHTYTVTAQAGSGYCSAANSGSVTVNVSGPVTSTWTGTTSANWNTASNWSSGTVPTSTSDVTIPATGGAYPIISSGTATVNDLTIAAGATLTLTGGTLDINEDFTNNGTFTATGGTTTFSGTSAQVIGGSNPSTFHDLNISSVGASLAGAVSVQHLLTLNGNLTTNGNTFTLLSNASGTAMVVNSGGVINGPTTVQRYIDPSLNSGAGYRHYASPVANTTIADLSSGSYTPVVNPAYNTAANPGIVRPFPTVFQYNQARLTNDSATTMDFGFGWESPASLSSALTPGKGYTVNIPARTVDFNGTLNNGTVTVTGLNRGATTNSGWHLLGNPYPSPIDWDNITIPSGMMDAVYAFRSSATYNGNYASYVNGIGTLTGGIIPAMQAFFVRTTANVASFSFTNAARLTTYDNPSFYRTATETRPLLQLSAKNGQNQQDAAFVYLQQGATAGIDNTYDAFSLPMGAVRCYTLVGTSQLSINGLPLQNAPQLVPLVVEGAAGTYTMKVEQLLNQLQVQLEDKQLKTFRTLTPSTLFTFTHPGGSTANRFVLHINGRVSGIAEAEIGMEVKLYPNPSQGKFQLQLSGIKATDVVLKVTDLAGKTILQKEVKASNGSISEAIELKTAKGIYLLQVKSADQTIIRKVVVE